MVRAVQAGLKTQTRRPMYPQPERVADERFFRDDGREIVCPFGLTGDRLWVRERFAIDENNAVLYAADPVKGRSRLTWQQSRYLPRESSRLSLLVLSTRPQQLQDISESDAHAEGYDPSRESLSPIDWFARLWDRLSVNESLRWKANPWLWVVHFRVVEANVLDELPPPLIVASAKQPREVKDRKRTVQTATIEQKQQLAEKLRTMPNN